MLCNVSLCYERSEMSQQLERIKNAYDAYIPGNFGTLKTGGYLVIWAEFDDAVKRQFGLPDVSKLFVDVVVPSLEVQVHKPQDRQSSVSFYMKLGGGDVERLFASELQLNLYNDLRCQFSQRFGLKDLMFDGNTYRPTMHWNFDETGLAIECIDIIMDTYTELKIS